MLRVFDVEPLCQQTRVAIRMAINRTNFIPQRSTGSNYHLGVVKKELNQPLGAKSALERALALDKAFIYAAHGRELLDQLSLK